MPRGMAPPGGMIGASRSRARESERRLVVIGECDSRLVTVGSRARPNVERTISALRAEFRRSAVAEGFRFATPSADELRKLGKPDGLPDEEWARLCAPDEKLGAIGDCNFYMRRRTDWPDESPSFSGVTFKPEPGHRADHLATATFRLAWYWLQEATFGSVAELLEVLQPTREPLRVLADELAVRGEAVAGWFGDGESLREMSRQAIEAARVGRDAIERAFTRLGPSLWDDWEGGRAIARRRGREFWRQSVVAREGQAIHATRDVLLAVLEVREVAELVDDGQGGGARERENRIWQARLDARSSASKKRVSRR
jgi:hypothetical protein